MDNELKDLLSKVASKKLSILQFVSRLSAVQTRLGSSFDAEFQDSINSLLEDLGKDPVSAEKIKSLKDLFGKEAKKVQNG